MAEGTMGMVRAPMSQRDAQVRVLVKRALRKAAASNHHPACEWGKSGPGTKCDCHVGAAKKALDVLKGATLLA